MRAPEWATNQQIADAVERVRIGFAEGVVRSVSSRQTQLAQLRRMLVDHEHEFVDALRADLGKPEVEAYTTEIGFTLNEIDHTRRHLAAWARPQRVKLPLHLRPGRAELIREPRGVAVVIAPWNYPLQLLLAPLIPAIAAGNTVILKPSELAPNTAAALARRVPQYLDERAVQVVLGGVEGTTALLAHRVDHIFYTGNAAVGRVVMRAAAEHLTPVTLELGGKSPAIVASDADIDVAARRIAWGKFVNAGQTCVAPDYVLVTADRHDEFVAAVARSIEAFYGHDPAASPDYGRIVNERHHRRLVGLLDAGGFERVAAGGGHDESCRYLAPTVLSGVDPEAAVMQEEIFGPILPVLAVASVDEAVGFVTARPKPLALYVFSGSAATAERVIERTSAGGVTVNHTLLHLAVAELPFGGVGESGIGAYHGESGFLTFSHTKPVLHRSFHPDPSLAYPPYPRWKQRLLRKLL